LCVCVCVRVHMCVCPVCACAYARANLLCLHAHVRGQPCLTHALSNTSTHMHYPCFSARTPRDKGYGFNLIQSHATGPFPTHAARPTLHCQHIHSTPRPAAQPTAPPALSSSGSLGEKTVLTWDIANTYGV